MSNPEFSVLIPTYNAAKTVSLALESILRQNFSDFDVWVIDGQSTDDTVRILKEYADTDNRIHWLSEKDNGIYDAMNKGIRMAKGEWLFFLGSDDALFSDDAFAQMDRLIAENEETKMVYGNARLSRPIGYNNDSLIYDGEFDAGKLLRKNICHQAIFYHRSLFQRFGLYRSKYKIFADYDFNLRCFTLAQPVHLNAIIAHFDTGGQSNNQQDADRLFGEEFLENMATYYPYSFRHPFFTGRKRELTTLLKKKLEVLDAQASLRILRILAYQFLKGNKNTITQRTHRTA